MGTDQRNSKVIDGDSRSAMNIDIQKDKSLRNREKKHSEILHSRLAKE